MQTTRTTIEFWLKNEMPASEDAFHKLNIKEFCKDFVLLIVLLITIVLMRALFYIFGSIYGSRNIFDSLNHTLIYSKMNFFDRTPVGRIISRVSADMW